MNHILNLLRSLDWRVLFAVPVLSVLLGVVNNMRVPEGRRVAWSGKFQTSAEATDANAERGRWTTNFTTATNAAETAHLPVVVVAFYSTCPSCARFLKEIQSEEVKSWQQKLGWHFVIASHDEAPEVLNFVRNTPVPIDTPPYVWVCWKRADDRRTMRNFSAVSGSMGIPAEPSLGLEWMHAVEASFPGAPGVSFVPPHDIGVQIAVKAESRDGGQGRVKMSPPVRVLQSGQKVVLIAWPRKGSMFSGWRYPDGQIVHGNPHLTLDDQCQAGVYSAIFCPKTPPRATLRKPTKRGRK